MRCLSYSLYIRSREWESVKLFYDSLQREESKKTFCALLTADLVNEITLYYDIYKREQYFGIAEFNVPGLNEVLCEAGAYMGETIEDYIWKRGAHFKKIYAFEPSEREYNAAKCRIERLKMEWGISSERIELIKAAVGKEEGFMPMGQVNSSINMIVKTAEQKVNVVSLDSLFKEEALSFLIADIEGFEMELIEGMKHVIERDKPKIAIAVYHKALDLWKIQQVLISLRNDYKFDLVHHSPSDSETVLYAY